MSKAVSKKNLFVCLAISLVVLIVGAVIFGIFGFNADSTAADYDSIVITDTLYEFRDDNKDNNEREQLNALYESAIEDAGFTVVDTCGFDSSMGKIWEYRVTGEPSAQTFVADIQTAIDNSEIENTDNSIITVSYHEVATQPHYEFIWRTAVGGAVAVVLLFAYVAIRFKVGMGVTALIAAVHDVLLTLAVVALLRIPAGATLVGVAAFSLLLSAILNLIVFGRMRSDFRSDERKDLPAREGVALSVKDSRKNVFIVCILLAVLCLCLGVVGVIIGFDLTSVMLSALMAIVVSAYSSLLLSPAIYACIKERSDAKRAEKAKYNYASEKKREKEEKMAEKEAKAVERKAPAGESN